MKKTKKNPAFVIQSDFYLTINNSNPRDMSLASVTCCVSYIVIWETLNRSFGQSSTMVGGVKREVFHPKDFAPTGYGFKLCRSVWLNFWY